MNENEENLITQFPYFSNSSRYNLCQQITALLQEPNVSEERIEDKYSTAYYKYNLQTLQIMHLIIRHPSDSDANVANSAGSNTLKWFPSRDNAWCSCISSSTADLSTAALPCFIRTWKPFQVTKSTIHFKMAHWHIQQKPPQNTTTKRNRPTELMAVVSKYPLNSTKSTNLPNCSRAQHPAPVALEPLVASSTDGNGQREQRPDRHEGEERASEGAQLRGLRHGRAAGHRRDDGADSKRVTQSLVQNRVLVAEGSVELEGPYRHEQERGRRMQLPCAQVVANVDTGQIHQPPGRGDGEIFVDVEVAVDEGQRVEREWHRVDDHDPPRRIAPHSHPR